MLLAFPVRWLGPWRYESSSSLWIFLVSLSTKDWEYAQWSWVINLNYTSRPNKYPLTNVNIVVFQQCMIFTGTFIQSDVRFGGSSVRWSGERSEIRCFNSCHRHNDEITYMSRKCTVLCSTLRPSRKWCLNYIHVGTKLWFFCLSNCVSCQLLQNLS